MRGQQVLGAVVSAGLAVLALGTGPAVAVPTSAGASAATSLSVPTPDNDPFYTPPAGYGAKANGTILRSRSIVATTLSVPLPARSWQLLYKSLDQHGKATAEVATVLVPLTPWTGAGRRPLVSYQTAEDSVGSQCAPSYALRAGLPAATSNAALETTLIASALTRGWAVVTSDYQGPHSLFLAAAQEGKGVLDGIRAAQHYAPAGVGTRAPLGLWGYSGGAFATAWAAQLQPTYAPELHVTGIAIGGVPADLEPSMRTIDGGYGSGLVAGALIGLLRAYPESGLTSILTPAGAAMLAAGSKDCTVSLLARYLFRPVSSFTRSATPFDEPTLRILLARNSPLGKGAPAAPVYDYHADGDELVPVAVDDALVDSYCAAGTPVQRVRYPGGEHNLTLVAGAPGAQDFLAARFAGTAPTDDC